MRSIRSGSTGSVTLKLTIPQIPHIYFPLVVFTMFDNDPVLPEIGLDIWNGLFTLEHDFVAMLEGAGIYRQQSGKIAFLHPHPKNPPPHHTTQHVLSAVHPRGHGDVIKSPIPDAGGTGGTGVPLQPPRFDRLAARHQKRHHHNRSDGSHRST